MDSNPGSRLDEVMDRRLGGGLRSFSSLVV